MYDIKNLNIWKKDSRWERASRGMKVVSRNKINFPLFLGNEYMESDITALNLSVRAYNGLRRAGWRKVGDIVEGIESEQDLNRIRNLGKTSINEIITGLIEYNISLLTPSERVNYKRQFNVLNNIEDSYITTRATAVKSTDTKGSGINSIDTRSNYTKSNYTKNIYTKSTGINSIDIKSSIAKSNVIRSNVTWIMY